MLQSWNRWTRRWKSIACHQLHLSLRQRPESSESLEVFPQTKTLYLNAMLDCPCQPYGERCHMLGYACQFYRTRHEATPNGRITCSDGTARSLPKILNQKNSSVWKHNAGEGCRIATGTILPFWPFCAASYYRPIVLGGQKHSHVARRASRTLWLLEKRSLLLPPEVT